MKNVCPFFIIRAMQQDVMHHRQKPEYPKFELQAGIKMAVSLVSPP